MGLEAGKDRASIEDLIGAVLHCDVASMDRYGPGLGVSHPDGRAACLEIIGDLRRNLARTVIRGEDLHREVRDAGEEASGERFGDSGFEDHADVGSADRRRVAADDESRLSSKDDAQVVAPDVIVDGPRQRYDDGSVLRA